MEILNSSTHLLTIVTVWPLLASILILAIPAARRNGRNLGLGAAVIELALMIVVATQFDFGHAGNAYQLAETYSWIPLFGTSWAMGITSLSLVMLLLAAALVPLVLLAEKNLDQDPKDAGTYAALVLMLEFFMVLIFATRDLFVFYLAFEAMLIPLYMLIGRFGLTEERRAAALKLVIYSLVGGLIMLVGVIALPILNPGPGAFLYENLQSGKLSTGSATGDMLIFLSFFIAFAIKAPMFPVHTWLADAAEAARPGTSTLLVGVLDKVGTYGMIIVCLNVFPGPAKVAAPYIIVLAIISILYGALAALGSKNLLRLISFTSVSHFGFMVMAIFVGSRYALTGAMVYMVAHGLTIAGLFLLSGFLIERGGTATIAAYGGLQRVTPVLAGTFLMTGLASVALPGLSGFVPEYMILLGTWQVLPWAAAISVLSVIIAAVYILLPYQQIFTGPPEKAMKLTDLDTRERVVITPLLVAMVIFGVWAAPLVGTLSNYSDSVQITNVSVEGSNK
ncbi:NADH-quinone oxidoreductase subunit M [Boudabousia liubingyangii]|uniref:NADH-quinone oxidoreductase subunit M n=1 Tax=Boudabousia liubingyangii TaxID=1921764 RepID=A0A1Q5PQH1_9ACTO|nr:NADH-quinone oxidoreductase subunit M [Boudabousia liubingyangii]OKL48289.1 NADH-quinone oxidoreductase subunit M [Boudabousia liubingyangii]OKL49675.1 NADH-quinone oxidoreductase subunit M [Boudabousia liubingyangii]